jgi:hypothetical protein
MRSAARVRARLLSVAAVLLANLAGAFPGFALTADEVLKLRQAGVSDETIQKLLDQETADHPPARMTEQKYATDHIGSWNLDDGSVVLSTGKSDLPYHTYDPTLPQSSYSPSINPYVFVGPNGSAGASGRGQGPALPGPAEPPLFAPRARR